MDEVPVAGRDAWRYDAGVNTTCSITELLDRVREAAHGPGSASLGDLEGFGHQAAADPHEIEALARVDVHKPYGRRVLLATDRVEAMIARWTRGVPCAPHDHGGSYGAVRVLQGEALHTLWRIEGAELVEVSTERVRAGDVMSVGPEVVHSMIDAGAEAPLVTLHLYVDPIEHMVVYDRQDRRTLVVDGGCGAWIPHDAPELIRSSTPGFLPIDEVISRLPPLVSGQAALRP